MILFNHEYEARILGGIIDNESRFDKLMMILTDDLFDNKEYLEVFRYFKECHANAMKVTTEILTDKFQLSNAVINLLAREAYDFNLFKHCEDLKKLSELRKYYEMAKWVQCKIDTEEDFEVSEVENKVIDSQMDVAGDRGSVPMSTIAQDYCASNRSRTTKTVGLCTGMNSVDAILGTINNDMYIIIAARPSKGKTSLAASIMVNMAQSRKVLFFSAESTRMQIFMRMLSKITKIEHSRIKQGDMNRRDAEVMSQGLTSQVFENIIINDTRGIEIGKLISHAMVAKKKYGIEAIFVDHIKLLTGSKYDDNENMAIAEYSKKLKLLNNKLQVPVIVLSQLNRNIEKRGKNAAPMKSDLYGSGSLEQDADAIMFIHTDAKEGSQYDEDFIIVDKNRDGDTGRAKVKFMKQYASFEDVDTSHDDLRSGW
jgi:replicative DNA helicase